MAVASTMGAKMSASSDQAIFYVIQSFSFQGGRLQMDQPLEARSEAAALRTAERLARRKPSVVVLARSGTIATGEFDEPVIVKSYGSIEGLDDLPF
ncbi:hypothetical protein HNR00_003545 [Methylorubrum rhodinum]|uniref:Uncharacterized protein n=1 Tax=Methylorubrum rhodinum TaxID=29428 RepID=A0A840ZP45_9HYPH|nr:hypothetical protein [Methylorubrum rhodinum]MBB5758818.1 hypothetical protein [Methylorubrum rhodinum]